MSKSSVRKIGDLFVLMRFTFCSWKLHIKWEIRAHKKHFSILTEINYKILTEHGYNGYNGE